MRRCNLSGQVNEVKRTGLPGIRVLGVEIRHELPEQRRRSLAVARAASAAEPSGEIPQLEAEVQCGAPRSLHVAALRSMMVDLDLLLLRALLERGIV